MSRPSAAASLLPLNGLDASRAGLFWAWQQMTHTAAANVESTTRSETHQGLHWRFSFADSILPPGDIQPGYGRGRSGSPNANTFESDTNAMYSSPCALYAMGEAVIKSPVLKCHKGLPVFASCAVKKPCRSPAKSRLPAVESTPGP